MVLGGESEEEKCCLIVKLENVSVKVRDLGFVFSVLPHPVRQSGR